MTTLRLRAFTATELRDECFNQMTSHNMDKVILNAIQLAIRQERQKTVAELRAMAAAFEKSAAADWPDDGLADEHAAFDDGLLTAAGRLRCRAAILEKETAP